MAILSTLYPYQTGPQAAAPRALARQNSESPTRSLENSRHQPHLRTQPTASILHSGGAALSVGVLFGDSYMHYAQLDSITSPWADNGRGQGPTDGPDPEIVWFCSECKDGPYCDWQDQCQACQHHRCSSCKEEET